MKFGQVPIFVLVADHLHGIEELPGGEGKYQRNMVVYRFYLLDQNDRIQSGQWMESDDDQKALDNAKKLASGKPFELWQGTQRIATTAGLCHG